MHTLETSDTEDVHRIWTQEKKYEGIYEIALSGDSLAALSAGTATSEDRVQIYVEQSLIDAIFDSLADNELTISEQYYCDEMERSAVKAVVLLRRSHYFHEMFCFDTLELL